MRMLGTTLSKAPSISRKTAKVEAPFKNADWIRLIRVTKLSMHDREVLKPDWNSGRRKRVSIAY